MPQYKTFWGDAHHNTRLAMAKAGFVYEKSNPEEPPLADFLREAAKFTDFYPAAYYPYAMKSAEPAAAENPNGKYRGIHFEGWKSEECVLREWAEVVEATRAADRPGEFTTFPGYEWQGDGTWGDHNVFYKNEGPPIFRVGTIRELYGKLRGLDAIAVPHHIGYRPGRRSPDWSACDERVTPFAEIFSLHGCSETDEEWIGLRNNAHMGPGTKGGTYQDALDRGLHIGAICSTDAKYMPAPWGMGLMACLAKELTRDALWEAFLARRVYGVTGDRIALDFTVNGAPMGSVLDFAPKRAIRVAVDGWDALDRIEVLRGSRVIATHCHQGTWDVPAAGKRAQKFKLRIEAGWGPHVHELPLRKTRWDGALSVSGGRFLGWHPCWLSLGQEAPRLEGGEASFALDNGQGQRYQNADVLEFEASPESEFRLQLNGEEVRGRVTQLCEGSRVLWFRDECLREVRELTGVVPADAEREDTFYHVARKAKIHRAIPEAGYTAEFEIADDEPLTAETHYRVRVEQRNGQRAWSSPIWVRPA